MFYRERPLDTDVLDDRVNKDTHQPDWHILGVVVVLLYDLDTKHSDQLADQRVDMLLLLRDQQRSVLQNDERDIDGIDGQRHRERDDPPRACWRLLRTVRLSVRHDPTTMILEEMQ